MRALFENLESGATTDEFLDWFPGVTVEQVTAVSLTPNRVWLRLRDRSFRGLLTA